MIRTMLAVSILALTACGNEGAGGASDEDLAADLWTEIDGYDTWGQVGAWTGVVLHEGSHGGASHVQVWFNDVAEADHGGTISDGGISVKETYNDENGDTALKIFVMKKIDGYDADNGDWFYARYSPDGTVDVAGADAIGGCAGCHNAATEDGLYTATQDPPTAEE